MICREVRLGLLGSGPWPMGEIPIYNGRCAGRGRAWPRPQWGDGQGLLQKFSTPQIMIAVTSRW